MKTKLVPVNFTSWQSIPELLEKVEVSWKDEVSEENLIPCWVSDKNPENRTIIALITHINPEKDSIYVAWSGVAWRYATPVLPSECRQD